jgi:diguanylate cyclase (GGDEF)-like protein
MRPMERRMRASRALRRATPGASGDVTHSSSPPHPEQQSDSPEAGTAVVLEHPMERRRASQSLWSACETLLSAGADPRSLRRALDALKEAFDCDGVALHALAPSGDIEPWCACGAWRTTAGKLRDCVSVPLHRGGERVGTLDLMARAGQSWRPSQLGLIRTAAGALGAALGARLELEHLRHQPGCDPITGLADARSFHTRLAEELARARRHDQSVAVVALDLDHFAALNARYGRATGDRVLSEAALILKFALRESDVVARLGGDEFVVLLPETDSGPALRCADRLRRAIEEHRFARAGRLSATAGVATGPRDGIESVELLAAAEQALSLAKKGGRCRSMVTSRQPVH